MQYELYKVHVHELTLIDQWISKYTLCFCIVFVFKNILFVPQHCSGIANRVWLPGQIDKDMPSLRQFHEKGSGQSEGWCCTRCQVRCTFRWIWWDPYLFTCLQEGWWKNCVKELRSKKSLLSITGQTKEKKKTFTWSFCNS